MKIRLSRFFTLLISSLLLFSIQVSNGATFSDGISDLEGDVIISDVGSFQFKIGRIYDAPYLDVLHLSYEISNYPDQSELNLLLADTPNMDEVEYVFRFEGFTGSIEGSDYTIEALDTIRDFIVEINTKDDLMRLDFYDASTGTSIENHNFTVSVDQHNLKINFTAPEDYNMNAVMNQENLNYYASTTQIIGEEAAFDFIGNDENVVDTTAYYFLRYWPLAALGLVITIIFVLFYIRKRNIVI